MGGEKQKTKCVDDNPTVAGSIVDCGRRFFVLPDYIHIYEGCGMRITDREGRQGSHNSGYIIYDDKNIHC